MPTKLKATHSETAAFPMCIEHFGPDGELLWDRDWTVISWSLEDNGNLAVQRLTGGGVNGANAYSIEVCVFAAGCWSRYSVDQVGASIRTVEFVDVVDEPAEHPTGTLTQVGEL